VTLTHLEPWLSKEELATHLGCGKRWIEMRVVEGMPSALIARKRKFRASEVEPWLERRGHIERSTG
jgi:hypothetical protein